MDDYLEDFILFDALTALDSDGCPECHIGILRWLTESQVQCDICDKVYNVEPPT